jgi:hypothetical protein
VYLNTAVIRNNNVLRKVGLKLILKKPQLPKPATVSLSPHTAYQEEREKKRKLKQLWSNDRELEAELRRPCKGEG